MRTMPALSRQQLSLLALLTLIWGINWPIMKLGVTGYPPLTFRMLSMWLGLPLLAGVLVAMKVPFRIERRPWPEQLRQRRSF
jgi:drug/metabolite transporter (DMT)-like permease